MPIALMIWVNDDPITGSVISLREITSPRKEFSDYKVGDRVKARLPGCGIFESVIGKLGDDSERKEFKAIIDSAEFVELLKKLQIGQVGEPEPTVRTDQEEEQPNIEASAKKRKSNLSEGEKSNKKMKNLKKKQQTNIEKAASCLELLELDLLTSSCISTVSSSKQSDATPSTPQLVVMPTPSIETQEVAVHQQSCSSVPETNFNSLSDDQDLTQSSTRSSSILGQSFDVLNNTSSCATYNRTGPDVQLQQRVEAVELELSKCWAYIHQLQNQVSWLYNQQQMNTVNYGNQPCSSGATTITESTPVQDAVTTNQMKATSLENRPTSLDTTTTTGQMSYTKEQLKSLCQGIDDYSKAGKRLFLRLFKREEYVGRSLTGKAPNRSTPAKPRIEDREKLQLLYDVVAELYGVRKESHINRELADLLKPSRCR